MKNEIVKSHPDKSGQMKSNKNMFVNKLFDINANPVVLSRRDYLKSYLLDLRKSAAKFKLIAKPS
jgi:hypothetical protein